MVVSKLVEAGGRVTTAGVNKACDGIFFIACCVISFSNRIRSWAACWSIR